MIVERRNIGILSKSNRTAELVHDTLSLPHKPVVTSPLDHNVSLCGSLFRKTLIWLFSPDITKYELAEQYLLLDRQRSIVREIMKRLVLLEQLAKSAPTSLHTCIPIFEEIARLLLPNAFDRQALGDLTEVLSNRHFLTSFVPPKPDEIQLLTGHRAKGLEFDLVFLLDLYEWILPQYRGNYMQDLHLHYVGITRARMHCVLCTSSQRHNSNGQLVSATPSPFMTMNNLNSLRVPSPY